LIIPTIIQVELYKWCRRERDESLALEIIVITEQSNIIPLNTSLALQAADIAKKYKLATADAIVYATAQNSQAQLITCDKHFKNFPNVKYYKNK